MLILNLVGLGWGQRFSISNKLPGDTDAVGLLTTLGVERGKQIPSFSMPCPLH